MNSFEQNKKATTRKNIKSSEFNRLNTQATSSTPLSQIASLFSTMTTDKKDHTDRFDSLFILFSILISTLIFLIAPPLLQKIVQPHFYNSLTFLFSLLIFCATSGLISFYLMRLLLNKKKG